MNRFRDFGNKVSQNKTKTVWVLKCDIRKFFASIDQTILLRILTNSISDQDVLWLLFQIVSSFSSTRKGVGLPLGNLTSQLLVNIYMNEFDQFVKHNVKAQYYVRYADDSVILSRDKKWLEAILLELSNFLWTRLRLKLHPDKVSIATIASGIDFLGWVHFPDHRVIRTVARKRVLRAVKKSNGKREVVQSYLGLLSHGDTRRLQEELKIFRYDE